LAEAGAEVLALEGSPRRARIAKSRTEGLSNVTLLTDNFDHFETELRFDVITLIGVLEYAGRFVQGANPTVAMLEKVRRLLKPNGRLIIAIENQFGLKYFAGALEDHVGQAMFGIEDRYEVQGVNTFGRVHLQRLLKEADFAQNDFYAPFPDYKLPVSVVSQAGFDHPGFVASELASQSAKRDLQMPFHLAFAPDQVWAGLERNGLAMDLSNSFLIVAQPQAPMAANGPVGLAWHYSVERRADWCKLTTFESVNSDVHVRHRRLTAVSNARVTMSGLHNHLDLAKPHPYINGPTLASAISTTILNSPWSLTDLKNALQPYVDFIHQRIGLPQGSAFNAHQEIPGQWLDALPQNIVIDASGQAHLIDEEWFSDTPITFGFLLFRAMQACALNISRVAPCSDRTINTPSQLIEAAFVALGQSFPDQALRSCLEQEAALQTLICGATPDVNKHLLFLQTHRFAERNLSTQAQWLQQQVEMLQGVIQQRDITIRVLTNSRWWRLGAPVRWLMRRLLGR